MQIIFVVLGLVSALLIRKYFPSRDRPFALSARRRPSILAVGIAYRAHLRPSSEGAGASLPRVGVGIGLGECGSKMIYVTLIHEISSLLYNHIHNNDIAITSSMIILVIMIVILINTAFSKITKMPI